MLEIILNNNFKIYLIAGEPSGDALGARLMRSLKKKTDNSVEFFGIGGDSMEKEGLESLFDISELAIMGLAEVIPSIPKVLKRISQTVNDIQKIMPDVVISIDSWGFGSRVQKSLRKKSLGIPQIHYVAPQVWAWKKKRAKTMYKYVDHLLTLFPHELKYFTPYGLESTFVGHPVIESGVVCANEENFRKKYEIAEGTKIISILPGSRHNEVSRLLPIFLEAAEVLDLKYDDLFFVIPTVKTVAKRVKKQAEESALKILVVESEEDRLNAIAASSVAIAASGTVALELAIANVPHTISYAASPLTAFLVRLFIQIKFVNLSNILINREIVPELLQENCTVENIVYNTTQLLDKEELYSKQLAGFKEVQQTLGLGEQKPSDNAADKILEIIRTKKS